ncbi:phosphohistidine phosphatase SixA [Aliidiomarina quisquiliarum]|uniref:phosphohistidine phosphatase SixA n=1 Tax=Aliidiomarina quisquiliarum TaxID=2938947 RepID=UPI00208F8A81|nr:phosphohistidine phosphatase SixA [Aliidiomarina quisquiliarum]MCO4321754.1 phosphohistidine phosphatase SixA [Aliidiomarina quisquiliarum]
MKLYVMRHGEAEPPRAGYGLPGADAARVLTSAGHAEAEKAAQWLSIQQPKIDLAIVSPYVRAQQTFKHVAHQLPIEVIEQSNEVMPESDPQLFAGALLARLQIEPAESILVVSHMPFVCYLVNYLDAGIQPPLFPTSGIAVLDLEPLAMSGKFKQFYRDTDD